MEKAPVSIEHQGGLVEYPSRKPLLKTLVASIIVYILSFAVTWYSIFWDSLISLAVVALGYYAIYDVNSRPMGKAFNIFYFGLMVCILLHAIAFGTLVVHLVEDQLDRHLNYNQLHIPTGLVVFLIMLELGFMALTGVAIGICYRLRCEVEGIAEDPNEYHELL
ncbi:hypothetical protein ACHHYP_01542 [Achlya hypogyna]|uniref:Transmembrane protein n=1 Tax=Achlya hypogyna TaxID=1202772 RepID=A0A1V9Z8C4_ACHHY|nr:hypothetical protein ACHHYP_01542 [Achlya hypogyna]